MTSDKEKLKLQRVKQEVHWVTKIIFSGEDASKKGEEENKRASHETSHVCGDLTHMQNKNVNW